MKSLWRLYIILLLAQPIVSYFTYSLAGVLAMKVYSAIFLTLAVVYFFSLNLKLRISWYSLVMLCYVIYITTWDILNGFINDKPFLFYINSHNYFHLFVFIIFLDNIPDIRHVIRNLLRYVPVLLIFAFSITLIQLFDDPYFFSNLNQDLIDATLGNKYQVRRPSAFGWGHQLALGLGFITLMTVFLLEKKRNNKSIFFWLLLLLVIVIASNSRYIILSYVVMVLFLVLNSISRGRVKIKYFTYPFLIIGIFAMILTIISYDLMEFFNNRLFAEGSFNKNTRVLAFQTFVDLFPDNPLFGDGYRLSENVRKASEAVGSSHIHVGYLQHTVSYGIVGSSLLFLSLGGLFIRLYLIAKETGTWSGVLVFGIYLIGNLTFTEFDFFFVGIIIALMLTFADYKYGAKDSSRLG